MDRIKLVSLAKPGFSFSEVVRILVELYGVHEHKRETFIGRLQQLQKLGLPAGTNVGRGSRARYLNWQLADLMLFLDMLDCGAPPAFIASQFPDHGVFSLGGTGYHVQNCPPDQTGDGIVLLMEFNALDYLRKASDERSGPHFSDHVVKTRRGDTVLTALVDKPALAINLSRRLSDLQAVVQKLLPDRIDDITFYPTKSGLKED